MPQPLQYLKRSTIVEPLVHQWYAWPLLVAPHTAALINRNLHAELLDSYIENPALHVAASANPRLRGGPYVNHRGDPAAIEAFRGRWAAETTARRALGDDIHAAVTLLGEAAQGLSMQSLYARLPASLRGRVELVYDLQDHASLRFIEGLFYGAGDDAGQGFNLVDASTSSERPFMLSTPRLKGAGNLILTLPFADPAVDALQRSRRHGLPAYELAAIAQRHVPDSTERAVFLSHFHPEPPPPRRGTAAPAPGTLRVRYMGHACLLIEHDGLSILVDPLVSDGNDAFDVDRFTLDDLPEHIDYAVFTHAHQDHVVFETLLAIRHRVGHFVLPRNGGGALQDPSLRRVLEATGFKGVIELDELQPLELPGGGWMTGLPFLGEHGDLDIRTKLAWEFRLGGRRIVCAADSNNLDPTLYDRLRERVGTPDILFVGMECVGAPMSWLYGPLFCRPIERRKDQARRLDGSNAERALALVDSLAPRAAFVYALGAEPWLSFISSTSYDENSPAMVESSRFVDRCRERGMTAERLFGMRVIDLPPGAAVPVLS